MITLGYDSPPPDAPENVPYVGDVPPNLKRVIVFIIIYMIKFMNLY